MHVYGISSDWSKENAIAEFSHVFYHVIARGLVLLNLIGQGMIVFVCMTLQRSCNAYSDWLFLCHKE